MLELRRTKVSRRVLGGSWDLVTTCNSPYNLCYNTLNPKPRFGLWECQERRLRVLDCIKMALEFERNAIMG